MAGQTPVYSLPYQALTDPPHGPNLGKDLAQAVEAELLRIDAVVAWTNFASPLVSVTAGTFTQGSTSYAAAYTQIGKTVDYRFQVTVNTGGGFTAGAGIWQILLPVAASAGALIGVGSLFVLDSGLKSIPGTLIFSDSTHLQMILPNINNALDSNGPGSVWATGDRIQGSIRYEAA